MEFFMKAWCYYSQVVIDISMYVKVMRGMNLGLHSSRIGLSSLKVI